MNIPDEQLKKLILDFELIGEDDLNSLIKESEKAKISLAQYLVKSEHIKDSELGQLIADYFKVKFVDLDQEGIDPELALIIPESVAKKQQTLAYRSDGHSVYIATANPQNYSFLKSLEQKIGQKVSIGYATSKSIERALKVYKSDISENIAVLIKEIEDDPDDQDKIVELVDALIEYSADRGASDIHLEPSLKFLALRLRIDGVMHKVTNIPKKLADLILMRIKIMSKLRTDEHRTPQDGKFRFNTDKSYIDVRVSIVPVTQGENIVMRLLSTQGKHFSLKDIGFSDNDMKKIENFITSPHGMILTTGPTGSGKTTTLYTMLQILNKPEVTVATIEDPVEYDMKDISQIQVNSKAGLTFAKGLRSIVRQDPDIIMVGEIRDQETANIAVNSAMTGHLVLSTLHANNAPTAVPRLLDMEIEPFLVSSTVNVVIAQRLVRKICERCRASYEPGLEELEFIKNDPELSNFFKDKGYKGKKKLRLYKGTGCKSCGNTGYRGRLGIFEVMKMDDDIKQLVLKRSSGDEIMDAARKNGMTTMLEDGLDKVLNGITTLDEVMRVTKL